MPNNSKLFHSRLLLEARVKQYRKDCYNETDKKNSNLKLIAAILKEEELAPATPEYKTKEQLYMLGFSAIEIHLYFEYSKQNSMQAYWTLKDELQIGYKRIKSIKDLLETLNSNINTKKTA